MPFISLKSKNLDAEPKNPKDWYIDKTWMKLCDQVLAPFPINRTIVKHKLEKDHNVRFNLEDQIKDSKSLFVAFSLKSFTVPEGDEMYKYYKQNENSQRMKQFLDSFTLTSRSKLYS